MTDIQIFADSVEGLNRARIDCVIQPAFPSAILSTTTTVTNLSTMTDEGQVKKL
jgi:hypothetical protein